MITVKKKREFYDLYKDGSYIGSINKNHDFYVASPLGNYSGVWVSTLRQAFDMIVKTAKK